MNQEAAQSEEVKDIVERMPNKFGRIACLFLIFIVSLIVLFGWLVKYPDVIHADLKLNAVRAPVNVVSHAPGKLRLLVLSKNKAKAGTIVAYIDNPASINAVLKIESHLNKINLNPSSDTRQDYNFPNNLDLGELSEPYYKFVQSLSASLDHYHLGLFEKQQQILSKLANAQSKIVTTNKGDLDLNKTSYSLIKKSLDRDSILYQKKVLSLAELEDAKINILAAQKNFSIANSTLANNEYQFESALSQLQQLKIQKKETENSLQLNLISSYHELKEAIKEWKIKYALIAPVEGVIEYADFWTDNQYVFVNQEIFSVVPETNKIHAQVMLPEHGAGKVHKGQKVIIKLNDFPYNEYGAISGIVSEISLVSGKRMDASNQSLNQYLVKVDLPNGLKTNYGSKLKFKFGEKGTAEIITADRRLYQRLFDNLKYQLKRE